MREPRSQVTLWTLAVVGLVLFACASADGPSAEVYSVYVDSLTLDERTETPVVVLRERGGEERELPIWIGLHEARSIALAMEDLSLPRPNTHDLIKSLLEELQGEIVRVVITELRQNTYYAVINVKLNGRSVEVDSRPSDAIAVAIRVGAPLFATDEVLVQADDEQAEEPPLDIQWRRNEPQSPAPGSRVH